MILQSHSWAISGENHNSKSYMHPNFTAALFTITRTWKQLKSPSTAKWIKMLYACMRAKSLQSCPTLCNSMDHSLPDSSVDGISQARILDWVACPFFRGSSQPRD